LRGQQQAIVNIEPLGVGLSQGVEQSSGDPRFTDPGFVDQEHALALGAPLQ
jgi:hypothetical protein